MQVCRAHRAAAAAAAAEHRGEWVDPPERTVDVCWQWCACKWMQVDFWLGNIVCKEGLLSPARCHLVSRCVGCSVTECVFVCGWLCMLPCSFPCLSGMCFCLWEWWMSGRQLMWFRCSTRSVCVCLCVRVFVCACVRAPSTCVCSQICSVCLCIYLPPSLLSSFSLFFLLHPSRPPSFFPCAVQFLDSEQINTGRRGREREGGVYVANLLPHCHRGERKREEGGEEESRGGGGEDGVLSLRPHWWVIVNQLCPIPTKESLTAYSLTHSSTLAHHHTHASAKEVLFLLAAQAVKTFICVQLFCEKNSFILTYCSFALTPPSFFKLFFNSSKFHLLSFLYQPFNLTPL